MAVSGSLSVLIGATIGPLSKGLKQAEGLVQGFSGNVSKFLAGPGGIGGALAGAVGGATVAAGLKIAVDRFKQIEDASAKAAAAIKMTGSAAGVSLDQVQASAKALSHETTIGTAGAIGMGAALLRGGQLGKGVFDEALKQSANMAAALGMEGPAAAEKLAGALKNPREGYLELAAAGVAFTESQLDAIPALQAAGDTAGAQQIILQALNDQMGDAAELAGNTLSGSMEKLWNSFDNIAAIVGEAVAPLIKSLTSEVTGFARSLDTTQGKAKVFEFVGKSIGVVADTVQVLSIGWQSCQVGMDALVFAGIKGFEWMLKRIQWVIEALEMIPGTTKGCAASMNALIKDTENLSAGAFQGMADDAQKLNDAIHAPWASDTIENKINSIAAASADAGKQIAKSLGEPAKQLTKDMVEAHGEVEKLIRGLHVSNATFGLSDTEKKARELQAKGLGADSAQMQEFKKLSNDLRGKELAQSLENPLEKFQREMGKLAELKNSLSPETFARAQGKLVNDLRDAIPDMKTTAGGAMQANSQEARSAIAAYQNAGRNADPQQKLVQLQEEQRQLVIESNRYLQRMAGGSGNGPAPFPNF